MINNERPNKDAKYKDENINGKYQKIVIWCLRKKSIYCKCQHECEWRPNQYA